MMKIAKTNYKYFMLSGVLAFGIFSASQGIAQVSSDEKAFKELFAAKTSAPNSAANSYKIQNGISFILDRIDSKIILVKFDNYNEIFALVSNIGPRGDEFLRNDIGNIILRINNLGGMTYYPENDSSGFLVNLKGKANRLPKLENNNLGGVQNIIQEAYDIFEDMELPYAKIETIGEVPAYLANDALHCIINAYEKLPKSVIAKKKIKRIRLNRAPQAFVQIQNGIMEIGLTPSISYLGRPSSLAIKKAILEN